MNSGNLDFLAIYMKLIVYNCKRNFNASWNKMFFFYYLVSTLIYLV